MDLPASRKQRNVALNKALKSLSPNEQDYTVFRKLAQSYVSGDVSAHSVCDAFFRIYPLQQDLFEEMASLLPNSVLCNELLAAMHSNMPSTSQQWAVEAAAPAPTPSPRTPKTTHIPPPAADVPIPDWILHDGVAPNSTNAR